MVSGKTAQPAPIVGQSDTIRRLLRLVDSVARADCAVLIEGESGTGKELIARRLHSVSGCEGPFVPVNCAGVSDSLFESQLFGHVRGAFTGAQQDMKGVIRTAAEGAVFLDEIGEMPLGLQPKLLRALQENEVTPVGLAQPVRVNARFIAATNRSLSEMVARGLFRQDLYYRLNVVRLVAPPLRHRREDIPLLLEHFLDLATEGGPAPAISPEVMRRLQQYDWPGNVRELRSWVDRLLATRLPAETLAESLLAEASEAPAPASGASAAPMSLEEAERRAIAVAMASAQHNQSRAAEILHIHRNTLSRKLKQYALS